MLKSGMSTLPYLHSASLYLIFSSSSYSSRLTFQFVLSTHKSIQFTIAQESLPVHKRSATSLVATAKSYIHPLHLFRLISLCVWLQEPDLLLTSSDSPQSKALRKKNTPTCVRWNRLPKRIFQNLSQVGLAYFIYLFFYSGMEFTLTFLTHLRWHLYLLSTFSLINPRFGFTSMQQGKMFFFIGLLMAVLQGGVVRRLPLGSEQKVRHLWRSHIFHLRFLLSVCHDGSTVDCAQFRHCWLSLLTSNIVSTVFLKAFVNEIDDPF